MTENMEPRWLTIAEAADFYKISRSSLDRWLRENTDLFIIKTEGGKRFVDVANSAPPINARLKEVKVPEGYLTLEQAREYYKLSRSAVHSWIREGYLKTDTIANRTYVDSKNSTPPNTRHEPVDGWKDVPGFDLYQACRDGRIRNKETCNVLSPNVIDGYSYIHLYINKVSSIYPVHKIIARTFIPNYEEKLTVNHKNKIKNDNRLENLEWATYSEQNFHKGYSKKRVVDNHDDLSGEVWKPIEGYENYMVSNKGRVKNINTKKVLACCATVYVEVKFEDVRAKVHRLVAKMFLPNYTSTCVINHKDGNRHNNVVENLECVTQSQNVRHGYNTGLNTNSVSIKLLRDNDTIEIFKSIKEASKKTGYNAESIGYASKYGTELGGHKWERIKN